MNKTLVLVRHGHRDTQDRRVDNGLSEKGKKQAERLAQFFASRFPEGHFQDKDLLLLSSPKARCIETLAPLEKFCGVGTEMSEELVEAKAAETFQDLSRRATGFVNWWKEKGPILTIVCSHSDWLPIAAHNLLQCPVTFKKGAWLELDWIEDQSHLRWFVPSFKHL